MSAESESESVSESAKNFCGSESESPKKVFGSTTLLNRYRYYSSPVRQAHYGEHNEEDPPEPEK
jgi:hypothetical protein